MLILVNQIQDTVRYLRSSSKFYAGSYPFLLYINDLPSITKFITLLYADDTTLSLLNDSIK